MLQPAAVVFISVGGFGAVAVRQIYAVFEFIVAGFNLLFIISLQMPGFNNSSQLLTSQMSFGNVGLEMNGLQSRASAAFSLTVQYHSF